MSSLQAFYAGAFDQSEKTVGLTVSKTEPITAPFIPTLGAGYQLWYPALTSTTVLPQGLYMLSCVCLFENGVAGSTYMGLGVAPSATATVPLDGTWGASLAAPSQVNFTCPFVSSAGYQSPKFLYYSDSNSVTINAIQWTAVKMD